MPPKRINTRQQSKTVTICSSGSKKEKKMVNNTYEQSRNSVENWEFHFKLTDIELIKTIIKCKDMNGVPLIIGAAVLNQKDTLHNLLKHGYNINEADKNNITPLAWSIKLKLLEMVQLLLVHSADPSIKPQNGDDVVCMALGSALWDEESFLLLFNYLKNAGSIDVNAINKNGLSLLHLAVRREWNFLVDVLILNDVNVNITTNNGVTPLMLASYRNDYAIVTRLLNRGAAVKRRNADGFTALCYAYSSAITKELEKPFMVVDKLQMELARIKIDLTTYIKERLKLISTPLKGRHTDQPSPEQMLQHIFTFILRNVDNAFTLISNDLSCGKVIKEALEKFIDDKENIKLPLIVLNTLFKHVTFTLETNSLVLDEFINTGCFDVCLKIMKNHEDDPMLLQLATTPIIFCRAGYSVAQQWFEVIKGEVACYLTKYEETLETMDGDTLQLKILHERLEDFKVNLCNVQREPIEEPLNGPSDGFTPGPSYLDKLEGKVSSTSTTAPKKTKRRTKALKAKIAKLKSAELTERFNMHRTSSDLSTNNKSNDEDVASVDVGESSLEEENMCVNAIKMAIGLLEDEVSDEQDPPDSTNITSNSPSATSNCNQDNEAKDWKYEIRNLPFHNCVNKMFRTPGAAIGLEDNCKNGSNSSSSASNCDKSQFGDVDIIIKYLEGLLGIIVNRYKEVWQSDKPNEVRSENEFDYIMPNLDTDLESLQNLEKDQLRLVHREFYNLTRNVKEAYDVDPECCFTILKELEKFLLAHSIRGETIIDSVAEVEIVKMNVTMPIDFEQSLTSYMEGVMAGETTEIENVKISFKEHVSAQKQVDANSMGDYVYLNEITHLPIRRCMCNDVPAPPAPSILNICDEGDDKERTCCYKGCRSNLSDMPDIKDSKWCSLIRSLEMMDDAQSFLNGSIRISNIEKRKSHILSLSGNFSVLEIGLAHDNKPLAVKILSKTDPYALLLKAQVDPLLALRHKYVLQYHTCAYEGKYLIIATPLCEYNLGQYVLKMRHPQSQICKVNVIRQLLSGLMYLHDHDEPIVHGNLKPSNVLIDILGTVKVAEFGIHKASLKTKHLPESSIIWFATELYKLYRQDKILECTCSSDIQVAGMLVHFAMNSGAHPFGKNVPYILKNLEDATAEIATNDMELYDLLTWMLLGEPCERPTIHQVLSHIFFWSKQKKWTYILLCAGLGIMSTIPMDIEKLHTSLDKIAVKENITGNCWVLTAKKQYPEAALANATDTPSGLLKFIKDVVENNLVIHSCEREKSFSSFILNAFPHFVLSLYRMIENTEWSDHRVFMPFHNVVDY